MNFLFDLSPYPLVLIHLKLLLPIERILVLFHFVVLTLDSIQSVLYCFRWAMLPPLVSVEVSFIV